MTQQDKCLLIGEMLTEIIDVANAKRINGVKYSSDKILEHIVGCCKTALTWLEEKEEGK